MEKVTRLFSTKKAEKTADRKYKFILSDETKDRHGTVIKLDAWDLKNYELNPIVALQHETSTTDLDNIVGKGRVWVEDGFLWGESELEPADLNPKADQLAYKLDFGSIRSVSVGFIPKKWSMGDSTRGEDSGTFYFRDVELIEFSIVTIPSNPNAIISKSYDDFISKIIAEAKHDEEIKPEPTKEYKERFNKISNTFKNA